MLNNLSDEDDDDLSCALAMSYNLWDEDDDDLSCALAMLYNLSDEDDDDLSCALAMSYNLLDEDDDDLSCASAMLYNLLDEDNDDLSCKSVMSYNLLDEEVDDDPVEPPCFVNVCVAMNQDPLPIPVPHVSFTKTVTNPISSSCVNRFGCFTLESILPLPSATSFITLPASRSICCSARLNSYHASDNYVLTRLLDGCVVHCSTKIAPRLLQNGFLGLSYC